MKSKTCFSRTGVAQARIRIPALIAAPLLLAAAAFLFAACDGGGGLYLPAATWVATEPIQCLSNPWEMDWLARHGNDYRSYPKDPEGQNAVIRQYYARFGVAVGEIVSIMKYEMVCAACSCPRGDVLYLSVPDVCVDTMLALGFRLESPFGGGPRDSLLLGSYRYTGYDSSGAPLISGVLNFVRVESTLVSGTWNLTGPSGYGPQIGTGAFAGSIEGKMVYLNLNPEWADNNVYLDGEMVYGTYRGRWTYATFAGPNYTATFEAVRITAP